MRRTPIAFAIAALLAYATVLAAGMPRAASAGTWTWPVRGPIVRGYDQPASPYGAGHRGIDIAVPAGTVVAAAAAGIVSFAGRVAGQLFVSIDHGAGLVSTSSYLSGGLVAKDEPVSAGQPLGATGTGHVGGTIDHLHFGIRLGGVYVDPLEYLGPLSLAGILWLAPILAGTAETDRVPANGPRPSAPIAGGAGYALRVAAIPSGLPWSFGAGAIPAAAAALSVPRPSAGGRYRSDRGR